MMLLRPDLFEKRETRIMRVAAIVITAQRTDRTLTMMVHILACCHISV